MSIRAAAPRLAALMGALMLLGACAGGTPQAMRDAAAEPATLDVYRSTKAVEEAHAKRARGERVWCVPFARTLSGINLRGNAETWWDGARGIYERGAEPEVGAVMVFLGHAQAADGPCRRRVGNRQRPRDPDRPRQLEAQPDQPEDERDRHFRGRRLVCVEVAYNPGEYGRAYPISGFVYPREIAAPVQLASAQ